MASKRPSEPAEEPLRDYGGLDPKLMKALVSRIPKNAKTGRVDMPDIMRFMSQHPEEMDALLTAMGDLDNSLKDIDVTGYDFNALASTIKHESFWVLQLENMGMVDASGRTINDPASANSIEGAQPAFVIYCYDGDNTYRATHHCVGLPKSRTVFQVLHQAVVKPIPPLKPALPWFFLLSIKLQQHAPDLKPFLDSLPAPFHWRLETREEADALKEGNAAFSKQDRLGALKAYADAIEDASDALSQKPDVEDEKRAKKQLAICYANRAAAYLMVGAGSNPKMAIQDGKSAEEADPSYAKGYIRQATAHQMLGNLEAAKDSVARALRRPDLENDSGLVDRLIDLYTNGKGLSDDQGTFKNWMLDIRINDRKSSERLSGIKGEWQRRCSAQFAKWN